MDAVSEAYGNIGKFVQRVGSLPNLIRSFK